MTVQSRMAEFGRRTGPGAFPNIDRARFTRELQDRIANPDSISQNPTSLCGPASLLRSVLLDNPELYVRYAIDLFETGKAALGKLRVEPGSDCRECNPGTRMAGVDWVTLASLRDSENDVLDYDDLDDEAAGITMPEDLAEWFEKVGYEDVRNVTSVLLTEGLEELSEALTLARAGMRVCLLIEADMLEREREDNFFANHWVMLEPTDSWGVLSQRITTASDWYFNTHFRPRAATWHELTFGSADGMIKTGWQGDTAGMTPDNDAVALTIWSWGRIIRTLDYNPEGIGRLTVPVFKKRFHGYVAGRFRYAY